MPAAQPGRWQPIGREPRSRIVFCVSCSASAVNEWNGLKRAGWQESHAGPRVAYRCANCSTIAEVSVYDDVPDEALVDR